MMTMPLSKLFAHASRDPLIRELTLDSRAVRQGDLFLAVPGAKVDGREHIADALSRGAAAVAYEELGANVLPLTDVPLIPVKGLIGQLSQIAGRFYGEPSRQLNLVGVTGTNGKTSVTQLVAQALDALGQRCGLIGTLGTGFHGELQSGRLTTPDPIAVQSTLYDLKKGGAKAVAMEVSSHALEQGRVAALEFDIAVMTNLSRDHLDYHAAWRPMRPPKPSCSPGRACVARWSISMTPSVAVWRMTSPVVRVPTMSRPGCSATAWKTRMPPCTVAKPGSMTMACAQS